MTLPVAGTLRLSNFLHQLDWHANDNRMLYNVMEGLVQYDLTGGEVKLRPALAESWRSSDTGRRWIFHLRRDVHWTDGVQFRAQHVLDGWRRLLARETASPLGYFLYAIKNARAFAKGTVAFEKVGVKIVNEWDVEVELERPLAFFPYLLTDAVTFPIRRDLIDKFGSAWSDIANLVTLGPYRALDYNPERNLVLARSDTYYDVAAIAHAPERVVVYHVMDEASWRMFEVGELDVVPSLGLDQDRLVGDGVTVHRGPMLTLAYLGFGTKRAPFDNPLVRRAVARAIDRVAASRVAGRGQTPLAGLVPPGALGFEAHGGLTFDASEARSLLQRSAVPSKVPRIELAIYTAEDRDVAESIQFQLKQNLGWRVEVTTQDAPTLWRRFASDPPSMFLTAWDLDFPDPDNVFNLFTSFSGNNHTGWRNSTFDDLVVRAAGGTDPARRRALYHEAQSLLLEREVPVLPLYSRGNTTLTAKRVTSYPHNALGKIILKDVRLAAGE